MSHIKCAAHTLQPTIRDGHICFFDHQNPPGCGCLKNEKNQCHIKEKNEQRAIVDQATRWVSVTHSSWLNNF